ncbi:MAG: hypothetical protein RIS92_2842 [Verrucomicrobiota bacterium]|jgi:pimeloyl-ACP methyl ester carboxylesterase
MTLMIGAAALALQTIGLLAADTPAATTAPAPSVEKTKFGTLNLTVKIPAHPAPGKPWLWVGEFGGHLQSLEDGLVAKGWHVVYLQYGSQFGSPAAMEMWEKVYTEMNGRRGLSARPALLGISRGGLYVNAWARLHPDRVSVLYLDNGVCDIRSWPGGYQLEAKGYGSPKDWSAYTKVFGFTSDEEAQAKSVRPTDGMDAVVKAGVFLISCHGTADKTVPYVDNAEVIVDFWKKSNGRLKLFPKEGGNHHPHGLPDPKPLIDVLCAEAK